MIVRRGLLRFFWREAFSATVIGTLGLSAYTLLWSDVMTTRDPWPGLLICVQCLLLAGLLGRFRSPAFAFIYSRGYTRDSLWGHAMLASALSVLAAWLPAALMIWTGLRSVLHDRLFQSPNFPIMAPYEIWVPLAWLALGSLFLSAFHYAWIRDAQPTKGGSGGGVAAVGLLVALVVTVTTVGFLEGEGWHCWLSGISYVAVLTTLGLGGRALHRSVEVRS